MPELRQPIISLLGHVDHGKTSLLDRIAGSVRAEREAGGITQHIGAIEVPMADVERLCHGVLTPGQLNIPGLLFIDTPGHRSFETLRRRGGALADLAVLVIDSREGIMPQTRESVQILKHEKTPFAVALTKIDLLPGWRKPTQPTPLGEHLKRSGDDFRRAVDDRVYAAAEGLVALGFSAERYDRITDFTRNVGIVPLSAKTGVGVPDLIALLVGLAQRFLATELVRWTHGAEATVLERTDERGLGPVTSVILYKGTLTVGDEVVVTGRGEPFTTKLRGIYRPAPVVRGRKGGSHKLLSLHEVRSASGVYLSAPGLENALPGGLLKLFEDESERASASEELAQESHPVTELAESGVAITADTLGGLEALAFECREAKVPIHLAEVGPVDRAMVLKVASMRQPIHRAVLAFNVPIQPDAASETSGPVKIFHADVMYRLLEEYGTWRTALEAAIAKKRREELAHPAKIQVLPGFVFRSSKPAIVGVRVLAGTIRPGVRLMHPDGTEVGLLRGLQKDGVSVASANETMELAASIDGAVVGRSLSEGDTLLVVIPESVARHLKTVELSSAERTVLDEVIKLRRATSPFWGQ